MDTLLKISLVATHPIQYQIPWYRLLAKQEGMRFTVHYALLPDAWQQGTGFGVPFSWDIPLLEGYQWEALPNTEKATNLDDFFGSSTPHIYKIFAEERPDAVIITGWNSLPLLQALWACIRLGIPRIVRGDSNALRSRSMLQRITHTVLLHRFDAFLSVGKANCEFYRGYGIPQEKIFECRHFVDNGWFQERMHEIADDRDAIRTRWHIGKKDICFLFAGKLIPKKRLNDLLEALEKVSHTRKDVRLLVVGAGELMDTAQRLVFERRLPVTFAGFLNQTEMVRAYVAADCLVLPSDYGETWGLVVNEAMVCGLPAFVSDRVGCGPDLIQEGETGGVFPFGNTSALAEKMLALAADREKLTRMGQQARQRIRAYSVEAAVEGTLKAIRAVTSRK